LRANEDALAKLILLGTQLDLLLNKEDGLQMALWDVTDKIYLLEKSAESPQVRAKLSTQCDQI